ncbi:retrotransposon protein, putative, ty1-copia subclass [Tanacetum coccineum]
MTTRNQEIDKALKDHEKAISDIQATLLALLKHQEQAQEQILKAIQDHSEGGASGGGGSLSPLFSNADSRGTNRPMRIGKVEFPRFSGEDVDAWLYQCEHFFTIDETPENMKLRYAVIHLEGDAIQWHRAFMRTRGATVSEITWADYVRALSTRFSNAMFEDPLEELASLNQTDSLHDYNAKFDGLLNKVTQTGNQRTREAYGLAKIQSTNNDHLEGKGGSYKYNSQPKVT